MYSLLHIFFSHFSAFGKNYFWIHYAAAFFERFITKTYRYAAAFLSQDPIFLLYFEMFNFLWQNRTAIEDVYDEIKQGTL